MKGIAARELVSVDLCQALIGYLDVPALGISLLFFNLHTNIFMHTYCTESPEDRCSSSVYSLALLLPSW